MVRPYLPRFLREGDRAILAKNAEVLKRFDFLKITVEGHCDERGSIEYNLALGERPDLRRRPAHEVFHVGGGGLALDKNRITHNRLVQRDRSFNATN